MVMPNRLNNPETLSDQKHLNQLSMAQVIRTIEEHTISLTINNYNFGEIKPLQSEETAKDCIQKKDKYQSPLLFIKESEIVSRINNLIDELFEKLDDPIECELCLSSISGILQEFEERKSAREIYFSDLLLMSMYAVKNIESNSISNQMLESLKIGLNSLKRELSSEDIKSIRALYRSSGLDSLPKMTFHIDKDRIIDLINEITT